MQTDITGLNMEDDWGRWQAEDEAAEHKQLAEAFERLTGLIDSAERVFQCELSDFRDDLKFIHSSLYRR